MSINDGDSLLTFVYHVSKAGLPIQCDVQLRSTKHSGPRPVLVSFHGGALFVGSRRDAMIAPSLLEALLASGVIIVYPDYRMLDPSTIYDQLEDIEALFTYLATTAFSSSLPVGLSVDLDRVSLIGFSAGSFLARQATVHLIKAAAARSNAIKLRAAVFYFGMGGNCFLDTWVQSKIDPAAVKPQHLVDGTAANELADCPYTAGLEGYHNCEIRATWCTWWWASGNFYDLCFGKPGLAARLRAIDSVEGRAADMLAASESKRYEEVFPELFLAGNPLATMWPPTLMVHGSGDPIVPYQESLKTQEQLSAFGVPVTLFTVPNGDHDLVDYDTKAILPEQEAAYLETADFLIKHLTS
ncbi:BQ2448_7451 [Microbotryum intermedium]|uniref:BQ2448_7451 protein n=1 Tax=Microbotryum intermedium TaxID=269621 RepID=A0A238FK54_9BASI|nr:BQ2448_7451 [Microbotryum intermedium]